jgi:hypothetical protein
MNTSILQKCVEELDKETPSIPYIKGMLETLIIVSGSQINAPVIQNNTSVNYAEKTIGSDQPVEELPAFLRTGPMGKIN